VAIHILRFFAQLHAERHPVGPELVAWLDSLDPTEQVRVTEQIGPEFVAGCRAAAALLLHGDLA
jgi:hypothetical protein